MNNLQLATTLVAPTGTGLLYTPYKQDGNSVLWVNDVLALGYTRSKIQLSRVEPKPSGIQNGGVVRINFKRTSYFTFLQKEYPVITELVSSIPVDLGLAARTAVHLHIALMAQDAIYKAALETDSLPT